MVNVTGQLGNSNLSILTAIQEAESPNAIAINSIDY